ncbi:MAG: aminotransferase class V-fold PLP-dependent enzyme [Gemmatimonadales bacterium]
MNRRELLAASALFPGAAWLASCAGNAAGGAVGAVPAAAPLSPPRDDESWWREVRKQFLIADGIFMNTGTFGASPRPVVDATITHLRAFETVFHQIGLDGPRLFGSLGKLLNAPPECFAITRNTTEGMNVVARGLDIAAGDEILATTHEHVGGICCWELVAKRYGATLKRFDPPLDPASEEEQVAAWLAATTPKTKVWSIAHVIFSTGIIQPVKRLAAEAKKRGIITVIDGAHPPGMLATDLTDLDCDFYASSPHKWLLAPKGIGFLYVSPEWIDRLWPLVASGGWDDLKIKGQRFDHVGTRNDSLVYGLQSALDFHDTIGTARIESRVRGMATDLDARLRQIPGIEMKSPSRAAFRSALVSFTVKGKKAEDVIAALWKAGPVRVRHVAEYDYHYIRLSTHIYNSPAEVETVAGMLATIAAG